MEFEEIEDLKMVTSAAVKQWVKYASALGIDDPLLPVGQKAANWSLEDDFRLFAEFWTPEEADCRQGEGFVISKLVGEWVTDRIARPYDRNQLERRASIIMGQERFFDPERIEALLNLVFPEDEMKTLEWLPKEAELREKRGTHILFYGCAMTDADISLLVSDHLMHESVKPLVKHKMQHPKNAMRSGWQFAPLLGEEDVGIVEGSWPTIFACMLRALSQDAAHAG